MDESKNIEEYQEVIAQHITDGIITKKEQDEEAEIRQKLGITMKDHWIIVDKLRYTKEKFRELLRDIDKQYADAEIEIWRQNNLRSFISVYPSLALRVNGNDRADFESHYSWSRHDDMMRDLKAGEGQKRFIENLMNELRRVIIDFVGEYKKNGEEIPVDNYSIASVRVPV